MYEVDEYIRLQRQTKAFVWFILVSVAIICVILSIVYQLGGGCLPFWIISLFILLIIGVIQFRAWSHETSINASQEGSPVGSTTQSKNRDPSILAVKLGGSTGFFGSFIVSIIGTLVIASLIPPEPPGSDYAGLGILGILPLLLFTTPFGMLGGAVEGHYAWNNLSYMG